MDGAIGISQKKERQGFSAAAFQGRGNMNIIGISGQAGSGKDTAADILLAKEGFIKLSLADPIKRFAQELWNFSDDQLFGPSEFRNKPDERYPITEASREFLTARKVLQHFGTEGGRALDDDVWIRYAIKIAKILLTTKREYCYSSKLGLQPYIEFCPQGEFKTIEGFPEQVKGIVIADCRFKNEIKFIKEAGGKLIRVIRPGAGLKGDFGKHKSEIEMESIPDDVFDLVVQNTGTLDNLQSIIDRFADSL